MLDEFLEASAARPFRDGETDCALTVADWIKARTGVDPAADLRGRYRTPLGRERLMRRLGGFEVAMAERLAASGFSETANPVRGDVGLIHLPTGVEVAAICTGRLWHVASVAGHFAVKAKPVRAWRVNA